MESQGDNVTASVEELAQYNMILTEAIFELLTEKNILSGIEVLDRVEKLKAKTFVFFRRPN